MEEKKTFETETEITEFQRHVNENVIEGQESASSSNLENVSSKKLVTYVKEISNISI